MAESTSPEVSGIKITVDKIVAGVPVASPVAIGHVDSIGSIIDKTRNTTKYTPINDTQFDEIVALGSLTQGAFSMTVLYDPSGVLGVNDLEAAIDANTPVQLILELNNKITTSGTLITQTCKVSSFKVDGEKDGKYKASFTAERVGDATVTPAA